MTPFIISGGPGSGKTSLINALHKLGVATYPEIPRKLIEEQSKRVDGILPWSQLSAFADLCLTEMVEQRKAALGGGRLAVLDRAIPDICGYLHLADISIQESIAKEAQKNYQNQVFFCKPEPEIYVSDEVRPYPYEQALEIHHSLLQTYQKLGYQIVDVPLLSIAERAEFVLEAINKITSQEPATRSDA
ncbi:AAA family ATPase [Vibrio hippocampi]|uniref:AAA family ATPase n=1 Tax=Vibrio hippocampi TaxID=654686 RepID=UPI001F460320|nr:AAA family ATPase [Vibrio hippocampi]